MKSRIVVFASWVLAMTGFAATPSIIPLPKQMTNLPGTYTLCPTQPNPPVPGHALTKILVDAASLPTGQYLGMMLARSTGYQFPIVTVTNTTAVRNAILITTSNAIASLGSEGYELTVAPDSVVIRGPGSAGNFYGVQSLLQLLPPQILSPRPVSGVAWTAPCVYIQDQPRFSWRGYMMDDVRHFFGKAEVKKFMDAMALQKMNVFHWHLVDDTGWRIQILSYPNLTTASAWRPGWQSTQNNGIDFGQNPRVAEDKTNSAGYYGGFYTQADVREIVAYAAQRHINVMPEIEMPAHDTSILHAYPNFGCGNASNLYVIDINSQQNIAYGISLLSLGTNSGQTVPFLQQVLTEVMGLFPFQYIHCGGDEVSATGDHQWTTYSVDSNQMVALNITGTTAQKIVAYQHWFSTNMAAFLTAHGRTMVGWTEFEAGGTVPGAVCMDWNSSGGGTGSTTASNGQQVVMALNAGTYINYYMYTNGGTGQEYPPGQPYFNSTSMNTLATVYNFEPIPSGLAAQYQSNILGAQCQGWSEYIPSTVNVEFKAFPRLCAMAETTWTPKASKNLASFTNRLAIHEQRLAAMGMNYDRTNANAISIGTWGPSMPTAQTNISFDITPYVTNAGDINVDFHYTSGAQAMNIYSVSLLTNGVAVDSDNTGYVGYAGLSASNLPYFVLHLRSYVPGVTYTIQASVAGYQGTNTSGTVYLVNWN